jgi:hypothetical protein
VVCVGREIDWPAPSGSLKNGPWIGFGLDSWIRPGPGLNDNFGRFGVRWAAWLVVCRCRPLALGPGEPRPRAAWRRAHPVRLLSAEGILLGSLHRGTSDPAMAGWAPGRIEKCIMAPYRLIQRQTIHVSVVLALNPRSPPPHAARIQPRFSNLNSQATLCSLLRSTTGQAGPGPLPSWFLASCSSSYLSSSYCCRRLKAEGKEMCPST